MATITTRAGKGSPLTNTEVDDNFTNLNTDKLENLVEDTTPELGGNLDTNYYNITLGDGSEIQFGDAGELMIRHETGGASVIRETGASGHLFIDATNLYLRSSTFEYYIACVANGGVGLYYDNAVKLATTSTGVQTTGTVNVNGAYTLPTTDGTVGQVLQTDGAGALSFATAAGGGGDVTFGDGWATDPGTNNVPIGISTLANLTTGANNVCFGYGAGNGITANTGNICIGVNTGWNLTGGSGYSNNTLVGTLAGYNATTIVGATYIGYGAGDNSSSFAYYNTAIGYQAGDNFSSGDYNVCIGYGTDQANSLSGYGVAIGFNTRTDTYDVTIGYQAGLSRLSGSTGTVCIGYRSGYDLDGGDYNTFVGYSSGFSGGTGGNNTGIGRASLYGLSSGYSNTAVGYDSMPSVSTGYYNAALGVDAGDNIISGSNNVCIGFQARSTASTSTNQITLGNSSITSLRCNVTSITALSDERDKTNIVDIPYGLNFINDLRPVQYDWARRDGSMQGQSAVGFIAQDLYDVELTHSSAEYTKLVSWDNPDKLEARPMETLPILVKAVQELSAKVTQLEAEIATLKGE